MSTPLIQCQDLALGYETGLAVRHLTFTVNSGDYLCLVGENGSGKSTLVKGLLGLLAPVSGTIRFFGLSPREIGYLPQQNPVQKDFPASVEEVVLSGCLGRRGFFPFYTKGDKARAGENMERAGHHRVGQRFLPGSFRRPTAAGVAGPGPVRHQQAIAAG